MKNNLLYFTLLCSFLCSSQFLSAQSIDFVVDNFCDNTGNVYTVTQSGTLNDKPEYTCASCYYNRPIRLYWTGSEWFLEDYTLPTPLARNSTNTSIPPCHANFPWSTGCGITSLTGDCTPTIANGGDVPTLSEWGLIILALLLMTLGTLYLAQPNWRRRFEQ